MKKLFTLLLVCALSICGFAQKFEWMANSRATTGVTAKIVSETDAQGNLFSLQQVSGDFIYATDTLADPVGGAPHYVLSKLNAAGNPIFSKWFLLGNASFSDICVDRNGFVYVSITLNNSNTYQDADTSYNAGTGCWIISFDNNGVLRWTIGGFASTILPLASNLNLDGFYFASASTVSHYGNGGNLIWQKTISAGGVVFNGLACNNTNRITVGARTTTNGTVTLDTVSVISSGNNADEIVYLLDTSGSVLWGQNTPAAATNAYAKFGMGVSASSEVYYLYNSTGGISYTFAGNTLFNALSPTAKIGGVLKFSSSGVPLWAKGMFYGAGGHCEYYDMMLNNNDEILVCGSASNSNIYLDTLVVYNFNGGVSSMVGKLDANGNALWTKADYRTGNDYYDEAYSLCMGLNNSYIVSGYRQSNNGNPFYQGCNIFNYTANNGHYFSNISESDELVPAVDFNFASDGLHVYFESIVANGNNYLWTFGDAQSTSLVNPTHTYATVGSYAACLKAYNNCGVGANCKNVILDGIRKIHPDRVANYGHHIVKIEGGFSSNPSLVKFIRNGSADIIPVDYALDNSGLLRTILSLDNIDTGSYHLVYNSPSFNDTLLNALQVELPDTVRPYVGIVGSGGVRPNKWTLQKVIITNPSNTSYYGIPLYLLLNKNIQTFIPAREISDSIVTTIMQQVNTHFFMVYDSLLGDSVLLSALLVPTVAAYSSVTLNLFTRTPVSQINTLRAYVGPSYFSSNELLAMGLRGRSACNFFPKCMQCAMDFMGFIPGVGCVTAGFGLGCSLGNGFNGALGSVENEDGIYNILGNLAGTALSCAGGTPAAEELLEQGSKAVLAGALADLANGAYGTADDCGGEDGCKPGNTANWSWPSAASIDPNYKSGSQGNTADNFVNKHDELNYLIHFENLETATAPAAEVIILDTLDANVFDFSSFQFTGYGFTDSLKGFDIPTPSFAREFDLRPTKNTILRVSGMLDASNGIIRWAFKSLDPNTYDVTGVLTDGFLNPNVTAPEGEGFVSYSIRLKPSVTHLQSFTNTASIYFDNNAPVTTNAFLNTVDAIRPASNILPLPLLMSDSSFTLRWAGFDADAGIAGVDVYMSINDSAYKKIIALSKRDSIVIRGRVGNKYEFYSIAHDNARNVETPPINPNVNPDASTIIGTLTSTAENRDDVFYFNLFPNPADEYVIASFNLDESASVEFKLKDILGKNVSLVKRATLVPGDYSELIDLATLSSGIYFLEFRANNRFYIRRLVKK